LLITQGPSLFAQLALSDLATGAIMTVVSLGVLCGCLILMVKLLQNVLQGKNASML
jgi:solute carrier family 34 (sodium-dependent phosphate cotransporter)